MARFTLASVQMNASSPFGGSKYLIAAAVEVAEKFPVLHYGNVPSYRDLENTWDLRAWGEIEEPARFSFKEFRALPAIHVMSLATP